MKVEYKGDDLDEARRHLDLMQDELVRIQERMELLVGIFNAREESKRKRKRKPVQLKSFS